MASLALASIRSALDDLELLQKSSSSYLYGLGLLSQDLKNLRTFLVCSRKLDVSNDSFGSLLERIEALVCKIAQEIHPFCLALKDGFPWDVLHGIDRSRGSIFSFYKEMREWYSTLSDNYLQKSASASTVDEVMEITHSVLENLAGFLSLTTFFEPQGEPMEVLQEKLTLLEKLIRFFAIESSIEQSQLEDFQFKIEDAFIDAAHVSHMCYFLGESTEFRNELKHKISTLLQKIRSIDRLVYEKYTQNLDIGNTDRMNGFIDFLLYSLWDMLQLESGVVVSTKDQLQQLYEGLRFFRIIFKRQPDKFDQKIKNLIRVVLCDAALVLSSLPQNDPKTDVFLDLLERIKVIRVQVDDPETSTIYNFPRTNELGFVDFLLENLMELTSSVEFYPDAQSLVRSLQEELFSLRSFLGEILELRNEREELQALWARAAEVAYKVEFLIDPLMAGEIPDSLSVSLDPIIADIKNIKDDGLKIFYGKKQQIKVVKEMRISDHVASKSSAPVRDEIVGLNDEIASIVHRLRKGSQKLQIVAIVGMPGQGKTTLAMKVYNHTSVSHHFYVRAWCAVSQVLNKKKVYLELLKHILENLPDGYFEKTEDDLADVLWHRLKGRRYLILLDDVWGIEAWNGLALAFPDDSKGSRIILTSRHRNAAPQDMLDEEPYFLRPLNHEESWELMGKKLFRGNNDCPPVFHEIGKQIAQSCKGLPLSIIIVAGLLASMDLEGWKEILKSLNSGIISSTEQCMNSLALSYKHLPDNLKSCFLYFGAFPEDEEVSAKRLIRLWIAEGFVRKCESKSIEDTATEYLMDLIDRSLIMVAKQRTIGGVKSCRIHDLLHDFCLSKAREDDFFLVLKGDEELFSFNVPGNLRRLCIHSEPWDFKEAKLFCPRVRSLLFLSQTQSLQRTWEGVSFVTNIFKLLSVLDLGNIYFGFDFPSKIGNLTQLRYLALLGDIRDIPTSIGNLSNLETFIVDSRQIVSLPDTFWKLEKLRHVHVRREFRLISYALGNCNLYELESFSGAVISSHIMEWIMRKFPNIRKLKCKLSESWDAIESFHVGIRILDCPSRLESVNLSPAEDRELHRYKYIKSGGNEDLKAVPNIKFGFPKNLKKLTLSGFGLPWSNISAIGKLPNLEVLKLLQSSFSGETWQMEEGEFSKLRFLKLVSLDIVSWTASDGLFLCLQTLVLENCGHLEEIPSCLEELSTIEMIQVSSCSHRLESLVKQIQEVQISMGNSFMKIRI